MGDGVLRNEQGPVPDREVGTTGTAMSESAVPPSALPALLADGSRRFVGGGLRKPCGARLPTR